MLVERVFGTSWLNSPQTSALSTSNHASNKETLCITPLINFSLTYTSFSLKFLHSEKPCRHKRLLVLQCNPVK